MIDIKIITGYIPQEEYPCKYRTWDFPEKAKHPSKLTKFGKEIIKMAKKENETWTVLTYSPMVIESIDTWVQYLRATGEEVTVQYVFYEENNSSPRIIKEDDLYIIYNHLGSMYDELDLIKLKTKLLEDND